MVTVVGVAGGSGSGKTTFARQLASAVAKRRTSGVIAQDAYYRDASAYFDRDGGSVNFDHPDSLEFDLLARHLGALRAGVAIDVPRYDFKRHAREAGVLNFPPVDVVIVEGTLLLTQAEVRAHLDLAIFIATAEGVRFARRLKRDVAERGRTDDGVREQFVSQVKPMHDLFIEPSRRFANRVISGEASFAGVIDELSFEIAAVARS